MKRVFCLVFSCCILFTNTCWANYYDDHPERYICCQKDERYKGYIDINSVIVRRYDPPFYTIDADLYTMDYLYQSGIIFQCRFFYNYEKQNIHVQVINSGFCDEKGNKQIEYRTEPFSYEMNYVNKYSAWYLAADFAFMKAYNIPFTIELKQAYESKYLY